MQAVTTNQAAAGKAMPQRKPETERLYRDVKAAYNAMAAKKMYSEEYMYEQVGKKFYRSPATIEKIVWDRI